MPSRLQTITVASAAGLTSLAVAIIGLPALADAATGTSPGDAVGRRVEAIRGQLQGLVDDRTLTDAQADKVAETLSRKGPLLGDGPGHHGGPKLFFFGALDEVAKVLGMSEDDVRTALRDGSTLAELAKRQGKDVSAVVAALTRAANARIDEAVKAGRLTQAQGDEAKKRTAESVERFVDEGMPGGRGFGKFGGTGRHPWQDRRDAPPAPDAPATPAPSPSTSASTSSFSA